MRLFIGIPVPTDPRLTRITNQLRQAAHDVRPVPPGTWHVTLRFLGDVADPQPVEDALHRACAGHGAMPATVRGVGAFQAPGKARVVWSRVDADGLDALADEVAGATADIGEGTKKDFVPHVTLARLKEPQNIKPFIEAHKQDLLAEGVLDTVVLYRSVLTKTGPVYRRIAEVPLKPLPPDTGGAA